MMIIKKVFGFIDGCKPIHAYILNNGNGMEVEIIEFGAIVRSIKVPDRYGNISDVTLGYNNLEDYENDSCYFGATIGRVASRTKNACFSINGSSYKLAINTLPNFGKNHLHGGIKGFNKVIWEGEEINNQDEIGVKLRYLSKDGEEGYPGNLECIVKYTLNKDNTLGIQYLATSDKATLVNLTHHSYFNLAGAENGDILNHMMQINAEQFFPTNNDLIPIGKIANVNNLPIDFRKEIKIGSQLENMRYNKFTGFDINYELYRCSKNDLIYAGMIRDPNCGRKMEVFTTQSCLHLYTGNFLNGEIGKSDIIYKKHTALCLEPQGYPYGPNNNWLRSSILQPKRTYNQKINYKFSVEK